MENKLLTVLTKFSLSLRAQLSEDIHACHKVIKISSVIKMQVLINQIQLWKINSKTLLRFNTQILKIFSNHSKQESVYFNKKNLHKTNRSQITSCKTVLLLCKTLASINHQKFNWSPTISKTFWTSKSLSWWVAEKTVLNKY